MRTRDMTQLYGGPVRRVADVPEDELIAQIVRGMPQGEALVPTGDDAAVVRRGGIKLQRAEASQADSLKAMTATHLGQPSGDAGQGGVGGRGGDARLFDHVARPAAQQADDLGPAQFDARDQR